MCIGRAIIMGRLYYENEDGPDKARDGGVLLTIYFCYSKARSNPDGGAYACAYAFCLHHRESFDAYVDAFSLDHHPS